MKKKAMSEFLENLKECTHNTCFIFSSPKTLLNRIWMVTIQKLVMHKAFMLVCTEEVHQFVNLWSFFRYKCQELKTSSLQHIRDKVPILHMIATFDEKIKTILVQMTRVTILPKNIFWCGSSGVTWRSIEIKISTNPRCMHEMKK